jgi:hypothetical protein
LTLYDLGNEWWHSEIVDELALVNNMENWKRLARYFKNKKIEIRFTF